MNAKRLVLFLLLVAAVGGLLFAQMWSSSMASNGVLVSSGRTSAGSFYLSFENTTNDLKNVEVKYLHGTNGGTERTRNEALRGKEKKMVSLGSVSSTASARLVTLRIISIKVN